MWESEFWSALDLAFGPVAGRSLASDLHLLAFDATAVEALSSGVDPETVWSALVDESGADQSIRWIHRRPQVRRS